MDKLLDILSYKRPYGSPEEEQMITLHLDVIEGMKSDGFGNRFIKVGDKTETIFSSHTDTVHKKGGIQTVCVDEEMFNLFKDDDECLGADDGAGIWLMLELIKAEIPGLYIFHRGEECGGLGSTFIATDTPELLEGYKRAIAFDRKGTSDIITRQMGGKCCSDEFAKALAEQFSALDKEMKYSTSSGSFTDTANYTDHIEECTNISVGYYNQHLKTESLDYDFLFKLRDVLVGTNFEELPTERTKGDSGYSYQPYNRYPRQTIGRSRFNYLDDWDDYQVPASPAALPTPKNKQDGFITDAQAQLDNSATWQDLYSFIINNPSAAADILHDYSASYRDLEEAKTFTNSFGY